MFTLYGIMGAPGVSHTLYYMMFCESRCDSARTEITQVSYADRYIVLFDITLYICSISLLAAHSFEVLHETIDHYDVEPEDTYNVDEKDSMLGAIGGQKRVLSTVRDRSRERFRKQL
ncbi:hypothetical protein BU25DRAFT_259535 [Macroventuria anomochaeta]|uniref:Uncharacterized protein n=1 Tax=Macroventuria anomochaeta TaxID=301207 RepID=A0ACB6SAK2_9PLEO|nr:uncharacterized protein BU25DRAFT_259535 [Macroventuria anomochaeta]KAF2630537.1 hypothetical protein BU25DRAFT_259535 [Macroventuria anomochaeta]